MVWIKTFFLLYVISFAGMYYFSSKYSIPKLLPGDIYRKKAGKAVYIPMGSSFIISIVLLLILRLLTSRF